MPQFNAKQIEELIKLAPQAVAALVAIIGLIAGLFAQFPVNPDGSGSGSPRPSVIAPPKEQRPQTTYQRSIYNAGKPGYTGSTIGDTSVTVKGQSIGRSILASGQGYSYYNFQLDDDYLVLAGQIAWDDKVENRIATAGEVTIKANGITRVVRVNRGEVKSFWIPLRGAKDIEFKFESNGTHPSGLAVLAPRVEW